MKKWYFDRRLLVCSLLMVLTACGGQQAVKKNPQAKSGGYYKDDGPGDVIPENLDSVPDAVPRYEPYSKSSNKPYQALGKRYTPMTSYQPYNKQGMASWYGKRYHGGKTSTGEVYNMYAMTAAHKTLPIPSYARVTNIQNGKSVVVRVNDRGPFINGRVIDLSYVAAHKLDMIEAGQTRVKIEAIDTRPAHAKPAKAPAPAVVKEEIDIEPQKPAPIIERASEPDQKDLPIIATYEPSDSQDANTTIQSSQDNGYYVQLGAFKSEENSYKIMDRIVDFDTGDSASIFQEMSAGLYRVKVGPYPNRAAAEKAIAQIKRQYNLKGIIR